MSINHTSLKEEVKYTIGENKRMSDLVDAVNLDSNLYAQCL